MKNTIKYMILALAGVLTLAVSCQREDLLPGPGDAPEGYRTVEFYAQKFYGQKKSEIKLSAES